VPSPLHDDINPVIRVQGKDIIPRHLEWGRPIYRSAPAMSGKRRYIEDQDFSQACIHFVEKSGGIDFFKRPGWRKKLNHLVRDAIKQNGQLGYLQRMDETYKEIRQDLKQSKITIEQRLDKQVKHLCFPWYIGSELAVKASEEVGYCCNYWGFIGRRAINSQDTNPFYLARMSDDYILTLPGDQRKTLYKILKEKFVRIHNNKSRT
jgi:hypothetical protein